MVKMLSLKDIKNKKQVIKIGEKIKKTKSTSIKQKPAQLIFSSNIKKPYTISIGPNL